MRLGEALSIGDIERLAKRRLPRVVYEGIASGVEDEHGLVRNEEEFRRYHLLPRHRVDVSHCDQSVSLFGRMMTAIDRLLMAHAELAIRNDDLPYPGL